MSRKKTDVIWSIFLLLLCLNSIIFYNLPEMDLRENNPFNPIDVTSDFLPDEIVNDDINEISNKIKAATYGGDYQLKGFFPYNTLTGDLDGDGPGYEWAEYDDIPGHDASLTIFERYCVGTDIGSNNWPSSNDAFIKMDARYSPFNILNMYSPEFDAEYIIDGKAHFLINIHRDFNTAPGYDDIVVSYRISLWHYNSTDQTNSPIASESWIIPDAGGGEYYQDVTRSATISSPYIIPEGDRLKVSYEVSIDNITKIGHTTVQVQPGTSKTWTIDDVDNTYDNSYTLTGVVQTLGVQLFMRSNAYPDIDFYGATNNTVYQVAQNVTVDVTDGSDSDYRWDGGSWIPFSDDVIVTMPTVQGWHTLDVRASEIEYNNTRTEQVIIGYDPSVENIEIHFPHANGSDVTTGETLNFTLYSVDTATYEWDKNGTQFVFLSPYDILAPDYEGAHNLTIVMTDFYMIEEVFYDFIFDAGVPIIQLHNVNNNSFYAPNKAIEVNITDKTGISLVEYYWDNPPKDTWTSSGSDIYSTNLPIQDGYHWLHITAFDVYSQNASISYRFYTDPDVFIIELQNLRENYYYQGQEEVKVTINKSNSTVSYSWNNGTVMSGSLVSNTLTLSGGEGIPNSEGNHNLTIYTFDDTHNPHEKTFYFTVDQHAPTITPDQSYDGKRFTDIKIFNFTISDNLIGVNDLTIYYSEDGKAFKEFTESFVYDRIRYLSDGSHSLVIYVEDYAGNINTLTINYVIDNTFPDVSVSIPELEILFGYNGTVPYRAVVNVQVDDEDPNLSKYYSWVGFGEANFSNSFYLDYPDGIIDLTITVSDSLGHEVVLVYTLVIDNVHPTVDLLNYNDNGTKINTSTDLDFEVDDFHPNSIKVIRYTWNITWNGNSYLWFSSENHDFKANLLPQYGHETVAEFYVYVEDLVENSHMYTFSFNVDIKPPEATLYIYRADLDLNVLLEPLPDEQFTQGNSIISFEMPVDSDLVVLRYYWNGEDEDVTSLNSSGTILVPSSDGIHTLTVELVDDTTGNPNIRTDDYRIIVDNIVVTFYEKTSFVNITSSVYENYTNLIYGDVVSYELNITDSVLNDSIAGLNNDIEVEPELNLDVQLIEDVNGKTFEIVITANDVTEDTTVSVYFWKYEDNKQRIDIHLSIEKKEGTLDIRADSYHNVVYEDDIIIILRLENDVGENETILLVEVVVNGDTIIFDDFEDIGDGFYLFNYSSEYIAAGKGNHTLQLSANSTFFYGTYNQTYDIEVNPISVELTLDVSNYTVIEGTQLVITGQLTLENGEPLPFEDITITIYITLRNDTGGIFAYDELETFDISTDGAGTFTLAFLMREEINYVEIEVSFAGDSFLDTASFSLVEPVIRLDAPGLDTWILYIIIAGSVLLAIIIGFVLYKIIKPKPFEQLMERISDEDIALKYSIMSPGVVLSIFDQRKGPVPLVMDHSLEIGRYIGRLRMGLENFLLKISDQAYSSLGFEEHDAGRRVGSIVLPGEKMIGWVHGIQLPNEAARGGFENLSLVVLADSEYSNLLLNYQEHLYDDADELAEALKVKKDLDEVKIIIEKIRKKSVIVMLTAQKLEKKQNGNGEKLK